MRILLLYFFSSLGFLLNSNAQSSYIIAGSHGPGDVYTDLIPDSEQIAAAVHLSPYPPYSYSIDLDSNGISDVEIQSSGDGGLGGGSGGSGIGPLQPNVEIVSYYDTFQICCPTDVMRLVADSICLNDTISDQRIFNSDYAYFWSYGYGGASTPYIPVWRNIGEHFIGFRILYPLDTLYGWIRVNTISPYPDEFHLYIMDFACNRNPWTEINEPGSKTKISVFPNPFENELQVNGLSGTAHFILVDAAGKKVIDKKISGLAILNTEFLSPGIYFYELKEDGMDIRHGILIRKNTTK